MTTTAPSPLRTAAAPAVRGAGWLATGAVTAKACQTLVLLVFAAVLDPSSFGVISLAAAALNITTVLADLGAGTALVHLRGDAERAARTAVTLGLAVSVSLVVAVWVAAPRLSGLVQAGDLGVDVLRGIVLCTPLAALSVVSGEFAAPGAGLPSPGGARHRRQHHRCARHRRQPRGRARGDGTRARPGSCSRSSSSRCSGCCAGRCCRAGRRPTPATCWPSAAVSRRAACSPWSC
ncbi:oligosaccharide flippase family protein [Nocardioides sp. W3-2-3]|uniref:oligosaccharide flippase family protein n=1 Tax=Nocardioides convexus TaxID=2712224 RepID=UPI0024189D7A|nr:oligosaccharide flippase family protein [Nocardioides convexus]NHA01049.1 oligosaccharide flippase family protein [Nocardioides convexus]